MPGHRLHIQNLALRISPSLHQQIIPAPTPPTRVRHPELFRALLDDLEAARIWTGQAVLAHNMVKIGALAT